jgi:collagenase-like PrtC family protease
MINHLLFDTIRKYPKMFRDNCRIGSVYGTFPGAIWNGGRNILEGFSSKKEIERIIASYNQYKIPVRFTWTNVLLEEKHTYDTYCNLIMDIGNNGLNQVLVNSPVLEDYIRKNYPGYKILSSTTKRILSLDKLKEEMEKDYFLVVLDYDLNHDEKAIEMLLPYAGRIEILVNETCRAHCPQRVSHYREISKYQLEFDTSIRFPCNDTAPDKRSFSGCMKRPSFMSNSDIDEYVKKGYRNFKIVGRGEGKAFYIDSLIYYLVKPESRDFIRKYFNDTLAKMGVNIQGEKEAQRRNIR